MAGVVFFKVEDREFRNSLRRYALAKKMEFAEAIKRQARLVAVNLAFQTQPFGDEGGKKAGEGAIMADLIPARGSNRGIFKPLNKYWMSEAVRMQQYAPDNFVRRFTTKNGRVWLSEEDQILTTKGAIKSFHQGMRTTSRKRPTRAGMETRDIGRHKAGNRGVAESSQLMSYVASVQKKVGIAKSGWASCAKQIGGTRGIPQWVTRHSNRRQTGSIIDNSKASGDEQYVLMQNNVPWIDKCLTENQMQRALDIQREKMNVAIEKTLQREARL